MKCLAALLWWCLAASATAYVTRRDSGSHYDHPPRVEIPVSDELPRIRQLPPLADLDPMESRMPKTKDDQGGYRALLTPCSAKCLESNAVRAGCGVGDWDCLCRRGKITPEIRDCVRTKCRERKSG
ncbi:hypothetical protein B0T22DRAFT_463092 [Podospora appendiculata]|uniref:CFEM domain-containing protein n=1 Tax=Podospora appendiculata TaxID=314037 RepID=A0AAE0XCJ9_9PEZI|nr:hypothetical protein B0T22DRAFT_463092 [Podospora appendiculata]